MSFRQRFTQTKFSRAIFVALCLTLLLFFQPTFLMRPLRTIFTMIMWPVQGITSSVAFEIRDGVSFLTSIGTLKQENERLTQENVRLAAEGTRWQVVAAENDILRKELELLPRDQFQLKSAEVIGRDAAGLGNWLTVNQGSFAGIERGMAVVVSGGILVGRVVEVFPKSARVMLLSHPESLVSGMTVEGSAQGITKGEYGLGIVFDMVPQDAVLHSSDRLVTSGLGGEFPKNLVIGTIQNVRSSTDHLYQRASVVSPVSFDTLRYVFIIKELLIP